MPRLIQALTTMLEMRDPYTQRHQERTARLAEAIALELGMSETEINTVYLGALVHDIGKFRIPTEILCKSGPLDEVEYNLVKTHPKYSFEILNKIESLRLLARIALQHHERLDGSGYPYGIKGNEILLEAKILGVADVVEAMMSHRPYRPALGKEQAISEIYDNRGILYEPLIVNKCIMIVQNMRLDLV